MWRNSGFASKHTSFGIVLNLSVSGRAGISGVCRIDLVAFEDLFVLDFLEYRSSGLDTWFKVANVKPISVTDMLFRFSAPDFGILEVQREPLAWHIG